MNNCWLLTADAKLLAKWSYHYEHSCWVQSPPTVDFHVLYSTNTNSTIVESLYKCAQTAPYIISRGFVKHCSILIIFDRNTPWIFFQTVTETKYNIYYFTLFCAFKWNTHHQNDKINSCMYECVCVCVCVRHNLDNRITMQRIWHKQKHIHQNTTQNQNTKNNKEQQKSIYNQLINHFK